MRKSLYTLLIILILLLSACNRNTKYDSWKDSVDSFGDGTYQVLHYINECGENVEILYNCEYKQCFLTKVYDYIEDDSFVYFSGCYEDRDVYCKLSLEENFLICYPKDNGKELNMVYLYDMTKDNKVKLYSSYGQFTEEERKVFDKLIKY